MPGIEFLTQYKFMANEENTEQIEINDWLLEYKNTNDEKIKKKLKGLIAMAYLPLVTKIARSFARRSNDPVEDIVQVGSIGLLKAVDLYSANKSTSFKTYATYLITGEIRHYLREKASMIKEPREIKKQAYRVHKITKEYGKTISSKYDAMIDDNNKDVYNRANNPFIVFDPEHRLQVYKDVKFSIIDDIIQNFAKVKSDLAKLGGHVEV